MAPFEKENPTSSTLHILKLSSRCPTMDSLVKFDDIIEIFYEFDKKYIPEKNSKQIHGEF